jgi:D-alanyl-lipoteichoic acid acyltransferase DltB (MBOAT superfamily)
MNFNSPEFALFFVLVLAVHAWVCENKAWRNRVLLVASFVFYASWNLPYMLLLLGSTLIDYRLGLCMDRVAEAQRRWLVATSLVYNLGVLCVFKYFDFFTASGGSLLNWLGYDFQWPCLEVLLPVGISFYTFKTLSYTIDVYRGDVEPERKWVNYALFVSFFPQLLSGPIARASSFLPQLKDKTNVSASRLLDSLALTFRGLVKKILIADLIAAVGVDAVFADPQRFSTPALWLGLYGYALQIYCDFSGYTDIAIGIAGVFGFSTPPNFNRPYAAEGPREFWRRWHISLSTWLRDYLYIPLGGNRKGKGGAYGNLLVTMGIGGLWHGAAWNFVAWGVYHGSLLVLERLIWPFRETQTQAARLFKKAFTFQLVCFGWLMFKISDLERFLLYAEGMVSPRRGKMVSSFFIFLLLVGVISHFMPQERIAALQRRYASLPICVQAAGYLFLILIFVGASSQTSRFIYFQF